MRLCVEGWRGINHSYAMVNQWQLTELVKESIYLRHKDIPFFGANWNKDQNANGFAKSQSEIISSIANPNDEERFDAIYRIAYPYNLAPSTAQRTFVFGTSEHQTTSGKFINGDPKDIGKQREISIITPSQWSKLGFIKAGFDDEHVHVVSHGIDPQTFYRLEPSQRSERRRSLGLCDSDFALLSVGAMTPNKGIDLLLVAFAKLKQMHGNLKLILKDQSNLYGIFAQSYLSDLLRSEYASLFTEEVISSVIFVSQNLSLANLRELYGAVDCYVSPYRAEGFNLSPLESAACGTPIIVTQGGSTDDYFDASMGIQTASRLVCVDDKTYLEPDIDALMSSIEKILASPESFGGQRGETYVHEHFAWSGITRKLLGVLSAGQ